MSSPYLSIVLTGRNDNYGGDFTERLQKCIDWNCSLLEKNKITGEFIIVNWNPVQENKSLEVSVKFPAKREYVKFKIITVSQEIHQQYVNTEIRQTVPLFEFIAKNAGIRRAKGEYILCINADILIPPRIFEFIAERKLNKQNYYRANRFDFKSKGKSDSVEDFYKAGYVVSLKGFTYSFSPFPSKKYQYLFFRLVNHARIGWEFWKRRNERLCNFFGITVTYNNAGYYAHCLNSGDFMLMHRDKWLGLNGYPEYTKISTHTDALFTVFAFSELKEYIFSSPVFHQEHERRYSWDAIKQERLFLEAYAKFEEIAQQIIAGKSVNNSLNNEDWGLKKFTLDENTI